MNDEEQDKEEEKEIPLYPPECPLNRSAWFNHEFFQTSPEKQKKRRIMRAIIKEMTDATDYNP